MIVGDRMSHPVITVSPELPILEALEMMGAREKGVRINGRVPNRAGEIAKLSQAIFNLGGNIIALGTSAGEDPSTSTLTLKVVGLDQEKLQALVEPLVMRLTDIRTC